jgi:nicotinate-nucleotide adenylyltransferase
LKKIGILGGVFNPVHMAHLIAAEQVRDKLKLDKILFIPSSNPPHKRPVGLIDAKKRMEMVLLAVKGNKYFEVSDIEISVKGSAKSYTADTLAALKENHKAEDVKFYMIIGMDQLIELHTWKEPEKILQLSEVVVINRPGYNESEIRNDFGKKVTYVNIPDMDISASNIRQRIKEKKSIKYLVPEAVENFITENNLYK